MREVHLWADGSGTVRGNPCAWAAVLIDLPTGVMREVVGANVDGTNNIAELSAVLFGLRALKCPCVVTVHSDSEYVIKAFTNYWIGGWKAKKWRGVKNAELWKELVQEVGRHDVRWSHVPGHSGVELNERCDKLAGQARRDLIEAIASGTISELEFEVQGDLGKQLELA